MSPPPTTPAATRFVAPADAVSLLSPAAIAPAGGLAAPPCLIVNPRSFRSARGLGERAAALARAHGAEVLTLHTPTALNAAIDRVVARRQRHLIVLAGDGTVHAIAEHLARHHADGWRPDLLLLPGGRSNLTANDLVPGGRPLLMLEQALRRVADGRWDDSATVERRTLRVEQGAEAPRYGFFIAAALLDTIIRRCHAQRHRASGPLQDGHLSSLWCVLKLAALGLVGRSGLACPRLAVDAGPTGRLTDPIRLLLATTLPHTTGLLNPYADRGNGDLRLTAVARRAPRFWRQLPRLVTGRYNASMTTAAGYLSGRSARVEISGLDGYTLDGEEYAADPTLPVVWTAGPALRFLIP